MCPIRCGKPRTQDPGHVSPVNRRPVPPPSGNFRPLASIIPPMRRLLIVFLLVLLPLRGWTADVMALGQGLATTDAAAHALCPDLSLIHI